MDSPRIGVIGVGNMGLAIALRLREQGLPVAVRDIVPAREALARAGGCTVAATPAALAAAADLLIVVVVDAAQTREVLFGTGGADGAAAALPAGAAVMLCPTIAPADTAAAAAELARRGLAVIDAPMSGGPQRAREGRMSLMAAADDDTFERWQPWLQRLADPVFRVGRRPGDGARTKLVNNLLAAVNLAGACEALALATRLKLDPAVMLDVIERSSGQSWVGSDRLRRALAGRDEPLAHMTLLAKDSALAMAEVQALQQTAPVGAAAAATFARALAAGLAANDDSALYRWLLQQRADEA
jgi:3-hydroxyisobutyrate dehydrogenase